ncbi:hypothetical protein [Spirosoma montaniterrae]|uniref:Uncharacterized protein n=1 Tax=Spirosoma montaniterrae TaxID=1178516 RepID=A0A1P9X0R8_9BACT|nr:hypothetical protein [Spirosoma montaniterrae]AQG81227.1 hypothetical protein AWR27_19020 [Spirosoma montaniterrae]
MQNILIQPRNQEELQLVTQLMKRMKIKAEVVEPKMAKVKRKEEILDSIERGAREVAAALRGEVQLKSARQLLDEL